MKYAKKLVLGLSLGLLTQNAVALDPFKDRARTVAMTAEIMLPDESFLTVDLNLDCGSDFYNTGMIVTSLQGAHILAAAYTHLWGKDAGQYVMDTWNNRKKPDDPRLPTYLVITPPEGQQFNWQNSAAIGDQSADNQFNDNQRSHSPVWSDMTIARCGTTQHDPDKI